MGRISLDLPADSGVALRTSERHRVSAPPGLESEASSTAES